MILHLNGLRIFWTTLYILSKFFSELFFWTFWNHKAGRLDIQRSGQEWKSEIDYIWTKFLLQLTEKKRRFFRLLTVCSVCSLLFQRKNFFLALSIIYKCQPPIPYIHVQGFWWLQFDFSSPIFCRLLIVHHLNQPLLLPHKTKKKLQRYTQRKLCSLQFYNRTIYDTL